MSRILLAVASAVLVLVGCGGNRGEIRPSRQAGVYEAVVVAVVAKEVPPVNGEPVPVVYLLPDTADQVPADVQVEVVKSLKDDIDLRFADERAEAIDSSAAGEPVHDDGLLLTLGALPEAGTAFDVTVEVYRSIDNRRALVVAIAKSGGAWTVTSVASSG